MRWLLNASLTAYVAAHALVTFGTPPSPEPLGRALFLIRPLLAILHLDSPARFFSANPIAPAVVLITTVDRNGDRSTHALADESLIFDNLWYHRLQNLSESLRGPAPRAASMSDSVAKFFCPSAGRTVTLSVVSQFSPTPVQARDGMSLIDPSLFRDERALARADCRDTP